MSSCIDIWRLIPRAERVWREQATEVCAIASPQEIFGFHCPECQRPHFIEVQDDDDLRLEVLARMRQLGKPAAWQIVPTRAARTVCPSDLAEACLPLTA